MTIKLAGYYQQIAEWKLSVRKILTYQIVSYPLRNTYLLV